MTIYKKPLQAMFFLLAGLIAVSCSQEEASMPEQASNDMADMATDMPMATAAAEMADEEHGVMTAAEQENLRLVEEWWRTVLMGGRLDQVEQYMTERYIQHNPNISTGRDAFVEFFSAFAQPGPIPEEFPPTAVKFAKGDYVVFVWEREAEDPQTGEPYNYNFFDVVRVQDGRVDEHWDSVFRSSPPGAPVMPVNPGIGPRPVAPSNTAAEQAVEDLVNIEMKDILQYQNVDLAMDVMAPDYIQHNPNVPDGRDGFIEFFSRFANPQPIQDEWISEPELILTHGDIALYIMTRYSEDPARDNEVYKWNWFDMFRVENGLIQEHWDSATRDNNVPPSVEPPAGFVSWSDQ